MKIKVETGSRSEVGWGKVLSNQPIADGNDEIKI